MRTKPSISLLTGAGISAESGLKTFRDAGGLWEGESVMDVATPEAFLRNPDRVQRFYNLRRAQLKDPAVKPNAAHLAIADFSRQWPAEVKLITQNVDDLHERAGSRDPIHMHGSLKSALCQHCRHRFEIDEDLDRQSVCPACHQAACLRPDIVWFSEMPYQLERIESSLTNCDLFVAIGTSGQVYPAAGFAEVARSHGAYCVEINAAETLKSACFDECILGLAGQRVPEFLMRLLKIA